MCSENNTFGIPKTHSELQRRFWNSKYILGILNVYLSTQTDFEIGSIWGESYGLGSKIENIEPSLFYSHHY